MRILNDRKAHDEWTEGLGSDAAWHKLEESGNNKGFN
jgi:hypothetical protein